MASQDAPRGPQHHNVKRPKSKRIRVLQLTRVDAPRGGVPNALHMNIFPFPFGDSRPARHGHSPVFPVGVERRVGAWHRAMGLGVPSDRHKNL